MDAVTQHEVNRGIGGRPEWAGGGQSEEAAPRLPARISSAAGGGALMYYGLRRSGWSRAAMVVAGGLLLLRGVGRATRKLRSGAGAEARVRLPMRRGGGAAVRPGEGIHVERSITVD